MDINEVADGWLGIGVVGLIVGCLLGLGIVLIHGYARRKGIPPDPIAEAQVFLAYGRPTQAEAVLQQALERNPDNAAVRAKLTALQARPH